jgi:hypothetical protein
MADLPAQTTEKRAKLIAQLRIESQRRTLGARSISETRVRKSNAGAKLSAQLRKLGGTTPGTPSNKNKGEKTTFSKVIKRIEVDELKDCIQILTEARDLCNRFLNVKQIDMKQTKDTYAQHKLDTNRQFKDQHGDRLTPELDAKLQNALAKGATRYFRSQVIFEITSEEAFEGSEFDQVRGLHVLRIRSKVAYTTKPITMISQVPEQGLDENGVNNVPVSRGAVWNEGTQSFDREQFRRTTA